MTSEFININKVIQNKNPRLYKILPRFIISYIARIIHQDDLNIDLQKIAHVDGVEKFKLFFANHNISIQVKGEENVPKDGRFIFASNHPLGGPDGMLFIIAVSQFFNKTKFLVNDLLMNLPGVKDIFLPINKHGSNNKESVAEIHDAYASDNQILIFPAGIVSRKVKGKITDLRWQKSFITHAKKYERDVIPVFISGNNSNFFYNLANFRKRIGLKVNIEMFFLVHELYKHENKTFTITFGKPISYTLFDSSKTNLEWAQEIKRITYSLAN